MAFSRDIVVACRYMLRSYDINIEIIFVKMQQTVSDYYFCISASFTSYSTYRIPSTENRAQQKLANNNNNKRL